MQIPALYLIYIFFLSFAVIKAFFPQNNYLLFGLNGYLKSAFFIFAGISVVIAEWAIIIRCFKTAGEKRFFNASIVLFPISFLFFLNLPFIEPQCLPFIAAVSIILFTQFCFFAILSDNKNFLFFFRRPGKILFLLCGIYILIFSAISIRQYDYFSAFNPKDLAIYNQTFWNTIHGRVFQNSAYGSNFSCHNSPFFFLLIPFYYLAPHPVTLQLLKTILLAFSVVPLYFIIRGIISEEEVILPLVAAYLLYPYLVSQNFTAPHEITYAPFFLLSAFYFYQRKRFWLYIGFLLIALSIKEHFSLIAIMFGVYALWNKRSKRWCITPIALGLIWGVFSLWIIKYFQVVYHPNIDAAWFIVDFKRRFLRNEGDFISFLVSIFSSSNIGKWYIVKHIFLFFACLGVFLPLLSFEILLGIPELLLVLLSNRPAMLGLRHYAIIFSCFIFISAIKGIQNFSQWRGLKKFPLAPGTIRILLAFTVFSLALTHMHTWLSLSVASKTKEYVTIVKEALAYVPNDAFITVPRAVAPVVSSRKNYNILDEAYGRYGDYVLMESPKGEIRIDGYQELYNNEGIILLKRKPALN